MLVRNLVLRGNTQKAIYRIENKKNSTFSSSVYDYLYTPKSLSSFELQNICIKNKHLDSFKLPIPIKTILIMKSR